MRIPRGVSGKELLKKLQVYGYVVSRQIGSHARVTTQERGQHHVTVPMHAELRLGTLNSIISDVALHFSVPKAEIVEKLFGQCDY